MLECSVRSMLTPGSMAPPFEAACLLTNASVRNSKLVDCTVLSAAPRCTHAYVHPSDAPKTRHPWRDSAPPRCLQSRGQANAMPAQLSTLPGIVRNHATRVGSQFDTHCPVGAGLMHYMTHPLMPASAVPDAGPAPIEGWARGSPRHLRWCQADATAMRCDATRPTSKSIC